MVMAGLVLDQNVQRGWVELHENFQKEEKQWGPLDGEGLEVADDVRMLVECLLRDGALDH